MMAVQTQTRDLDRGSYASITTIKWLRFATVILALLDAAAHIFASPGTSAPQTFWLETEVAFYVLIAVIFLLGLRTWYAASIAYSVLNVLLFFLSAFVAIPLITHAALAGHVQFGQYSFGRGFSLAGWLWLIIGGWILMRIDHGSKIDQLLKDS
jgi:hypothetical protein